MADFRYAAEWNQHARRGSDIVDPVLIVRQLSRFEFTMRRPTSQIDHALVFSDGRGKYAVYVPPHRPTRAELAAGRYVSVHEVDTGIHHLTLDFRLPSDDEAFTFGTQAELTWQVTAPDRVVDSGLRDVPAILRPKLEQRMRRVSRGFSIEHSRQAEEAVQDDINALQPAGEYGLHVTCAVRLELDDAARDQRTQLRDIGYRHDLLRPQYELEQARAGYQYQLDALQAQQEQQLLAQKAEFYRYYLEHGGVLQWALQLAQRPEDLPNASHGLREDQKAAITGQLDLLRQVADTGRFEDYQLEDATRQTLRRIHDHFAGPAQPPAQLPAAGPDTAPPPYPAAAPPAPGVPPVPPAPPAPQAPPGAPDPRTVDPRTAAYPPPPPAGGPEPE
ncbi:hypothetical protein GCM10009716_39870 [Streptomyces sodiiphilus]|uniref:PE-PGRS family protein n=1 Tax=Streptomyces sodiiphilus TaxID=226217 RepID=A0ABN2PQB1_9ACTN